jgi:glycerol-1-phosphate dehydrogenase [NAD(P)+]
MKEYNDLDTFLELDPSELADSVLHCPVCGRDHKIPFQVVREGLGHIADFPEMAETILGRTPKKIGVIYDRQIEEKLKNLFFEPFSQTGAGFERLPVGEKGLLLEASVELGDEIAGTLPEDLDFLIGVGSGVISDLTKWTATKAGLPFVLVGTAASMNAYTSITGTMTENNVKTSKWLDPANGVLLDPQLLASAPGAMTAAGVGDLLARNVANADWKLSQFLRGTYFCQVPFMMMNEYQRRLLLHIGTLSHNGLHAMEILSRAVLVSGYSMTVLDGETSPSSGSEHIISHFFDFQHEVFDLPKNLHGAQVGVGTIIMSYAYEMLREMSPADFDMDDIERRRLSQTAINLDHRRVFGEKNAVFDEVVAKKRISDEDFRNYLQNILNSWVLIWHVVDPFLMPADELRQAMEKTGAITTLSGLFRSKEDAIQALLYGSHYRPRYTILDLFWELGLFPQVAPEILARAKVLD